MTKFFNWELHNKTQDPNSITLSAITPDVRQN